MPTYNRCVLVSEFDYALPPELIAQEPLPNRAASRMLRLDRLSGELKDSTFGEFANLLRPDDLVVFNNTRVFPARLFGHRSGARSQPLSPRNPAARAFLKGKIEVLLTRQIAAEPRQVWQALVHPGRKIGVGEHLFLGDRGELEAEVIGRGEYGERTLRFAPVPEFFVLVERIGHVPLPPYIDRPDRPPDRERYQTVYARELGSVAAPTAGLHFTPDILAHMRERGIAKAEITLHVGLGTFQPVHVDCVEEHRMHNESYTVSETAAAQINQAIQCGRRVIAIGTTTVRTLEHAAKQGNGAIPAGTSEADLFIYPGFRFRIVSALLTNFHLPRSTLLMLVCAFAGRDKVLAAYRHAVQRKYRFYSYGDCMFVDEW